MKEFYFRDETDPNYVPDVLEISHEIEALIYQIKMTLGTSQGEVIGSSKFGGNLDDILFSVNYNPNAWKPKIMEQLQTYSQLARENTLVISSKSIQNGYQDIGILDVAINGKSVMGFAYNGK